MQQLETNGLNLFNYGALGLYVLAAICYVVGLVQNQASVAKLGRSLFIVGLFVHTLALVFITVAIGRAPFLNLYEYLLCFTWAGAVVYLLTELTTKNAALGAFAVPLVAVMAFFTQRLPNAKLDDSVMPALRSAWRVPHVGSAILAYGAFLVAFVLAIMFLIRDNVDRSQSKGAAARSWWGSRLPPAEQLDRATYRVIAFGFLMQTVLVIVGAIWAQIAWGRYWGWDPKETWSFITWLIYATYLHTRTAMGWRGRRSAWLAIIGFAATLFTLLGVSYLLSGLHSYAGG